MLNERITNLYTTIELKQKNRNDLELRFDEIQEKLKRKRVEAAIVDQKLSKINDDIIQNLDIDEGINQVNLLGLSKSIKALR